jgi:hypothetical protein
LQQIDHSSTAKGTFAQKVILDIDPDNVNERTPIILSIPPFMPANDSQRAASLKNIGSSLKAIQIAI